MKNAISFLSAPKGTSEALIYTPHSKICIPRKRRLFAWEAWIPYPVNNNFNGAKITSEICPSLHLLLYFTI